ncbi:MAG: 5-guanidino-2-oxopentanoate decarboxylase [Alphaproteobacteria bacterium]|nr:5-guanidino-2-oxopentanoate decarboxylase [Alphaproteobacteria bacterium]
MPAETTVGEALVRLLEEYGVAHVFGVPGVHTIELYRGLTQSPIRHILPRHEQGAAFMADGYARATGQPGVCFLISGPGLLNAATAIGQAYSDSVPLLVIASAIARADLGMGRGRLHEMQDQRAAAETVSAWSETALAAAAIPDLAARAFADFAVKRPRPVVLNIPIDLFPEPAAGDWTARPLPAIALPAEWDVREAAGRLARSSKPMLIVGGGAVRASAEITALAEALQAPVVTTIAGKGVVPNGHPLLAGAMMAASEIRDLIRAADTVLAVGTEFASPDFWDGEIEVPGVLIRVDIDPAELSDAYRADLPICADAKATVAAINRELPALLLNNPARAVPDLSALRHSVYGAGDAARARHRAALEGFRRALPEDAIVATDMTRIAYAGNEIFPVSGPGQWLHPVGFGTLGYALPAAIGAKIGRPETPVAALVGDYGFQYTAMELMTAVELELSLPILIWNNDALGEIRAGMRQAGFAPLAVEQANPNFAQFAAACGAGYERAGSPRAIETAVTAALQADGPTLIEAIAVEF